MPHRVNVHRYVQLLFRGVQLLPKQSDNKHTFLLRYSGKDNSDRPDFLYLNDYLTSILPANYQISVLLFGLFDNPITNPEHRLSYMFHMPSHTLWCT